MHLKLVVDTYYPDDVEYHHMEAAKHEAALEMHLETARLYFLNQADEAHLRAMDAAKLSREATHSRKRNRP